MRERGPHGGREGWCGRGQVLEFPQSFFEYSGKIRMQEEGPFWLSSTIPQPGSCQLWDDVGAFHWWVTEESCGREHLSRKLETQLSVCMMISIPWLVPITFNAPFRVPFGARR